MTICLTSIAAGCATDRELPDWTPVTTDIQATRPAPKCRWPDLPDPDPAGNFVITADDFRLIVACQASEQGNHAIADANADSVDALIATLDRLNDAGETYVTLARFRTDELEADRREARIQAWTAKALTAVVLIAVAVF